MTNSSLPLTRSSRTGAWDRIGRKLDLPASDPTAYEKSGLNWTVTKEPLYRQNMDEVATHVAMIRSDNDRQLGVVGSGFTPVQNEDLFRFLRDLDGFSNVKLTCAGMLNGGETVWVRSRVDGLSFDINGDSTECYMDLTNGHIGNQRLSIMPRVERLICTNGMRALVPVMVRNHRNKLTAGYNLRHSRGITDTLNSIRDSLVYTTKAFKATEDAMRLLAAKPMTRDAVDRLFSMTFAKPKDVNPKAETGDLTGLADDESARAISIRQARERKLHELLEAPTNNHPGTRGTLYAAFQTVGEYIDHEMPVRTATGTEEAKAMARFTSAHFGTSDELKERALEFAMDLAGA